MGAIRTSERACRPAASKDRVVARLIGKVYGEVCEPGTTLEAAGSRAGRRQDLWCTGSGPRRIGRAALICWVNWGGGVTSSAGFLRAGAPVSG